ncbi:hypothetical protein BDW74DRAFT_111408 [Aspergillus multicolor]|uniref:putative RNA binding protein Rnp24 n=1 Tax=Aspergillus multicolor TaxID=41759 RepID=UPI003CCCC964
MTSIGEDNHKKRKLLDGPELEIDVSAPEPPSKKALRKAKKKASDTDTNVDKSKIDINVATANQATEAAPQKRSEYGVWIGNLAFSVTKDDVRRFLTTNCSFTDATITRIHLPRPSEKNSRAQNKGFAYVDFSTPKAVEEAIGLSEQLVSGRRVLIKDANSYKGRPEKSQDGGNNTASTSSGRAPSKRLFVGNLSFDATKDFLEEHFSKCGTVANVHVATFQDSGKCKGYAWVEFEDLEAAITAERGFKYVTEDDEAEQDPAQKPQRRKVWLNQILGRRMRLEFAEDATTRYNKRFGKNGERKGAADNGEEEAGDFEEVAAEGKPQQRKVKNSKPDYTRYDQSTVQKLSGAIIEGQGKKTTFD